MQKGRAMEGQFLRQGRKTPWTCLLDNKPDSDLMSALSVFCPGFTLSS